MELVTQTLLTVLILFLGLTVFLQGKRGMAAAALIISSISLIKGLSWSVPAVLCSITLAAWVAEGKIQTLVQDKSKGALFAGLMESFILLLLFGIFLGPVGSLLAWLIASGLHLLPQFRTRVGKIGIWGVSFYRGGLSLSSLALGLYTIYK